MNLVSTGMGVPASTNVASFSLNSSKPSSRLSVMEKAAGSWPLAWGWHVPANDAKNANTPKPSAARPFMVFFTSGRP
jgi:hypothetical protein